MRKLMALATAGLMSLSVAACSSDAGQKEQVGTLLGAGVGALAGSKIGGGGGRDIAIAAGALLGAGLGNQIGKSLDRADRLAIQQTTQRSLESVPSGQTTSWTNPDSGNSGTVTPQPAYTNASGQYCREFQQTITVGGEQQSGYGTACRQPDGSWEIKS